MNDDVFSRRRVLQAAAVGAAAIVAPVASPSFGVRRAAASPLPHGWALPPGFDLPTAAGLAVPFVHGVASGDPLADRVILWTRVTLPEAPSNGDIEVRWRVATDAALTQVVAYGAVRTGAERDWTVKIDAAGLRPATTYYYGFSVGDRDSIVGRTRTAPEGSADRVRLGVVACTSYWSGHFNAYARLAARQDLDLVVHCGDHIYEVPDPEEWVRSRDGRFDPGLPDFRGWTTLGEIRRRYALYYADPDFVALHRTHPMAIIWDNHDLTATSSTTRADALRAFWEWTPTRPPLGDGSGRFGPPAEGQVDPANPGLVYRRLPYGNVADILLIDTRHIGREARTARNFTTRRLLGDRQLDWLSGEMRDSRAGGAAWRVVVNQVLMGQLKLLNLPGPGGFPFIPQIQQGVVLNPDQWDGYPRERELLFGRIRDAGVRGNLVVTGDMHGSFCGDLVEDATFPRYRPDTGRGSIGVEFAPSSVSRGGVDETVAGALYTRLRGRPVRTDRRGFEQFRANGRETSRFVCNSLRVLNPALKFAEWTQHGYGIVDLNRDRAALEFWWQPIATRSTTDVLGAQFTVRRDADRAERVWAPRPT